MSFCSSGSTSSTTKYELVCVKYCATWRWPNASLSVSSITCGWMPKRAAASRLMLIESSGAFDCWSVETSASSGSVLNFSSIFGAQVFSSLRSGSCKRVLILPARDAAADRDVLRGLQEQRDAFEPGDLRAQPRDDLRGACAALLVRLQPDKEARGVERVAAARAEEGAERRDVGILRQHCRRPGAAAASSRPARRPVRPP